MSNSISLITGIVSVILAIFAIILSYRFDRRSSATHKIIDKKLDTIDKKQDTLYDVIDGVKEKINSDPNISQEAKKRVKESLDMVTDNYYSGSSKYIQRQDRASVINRVEHDLIERITNRQGYASSCPNSFVDIKATYHNMKLYFTYSVRNTITGEDWPKSSADSFFLSRVETYKLQKDSLIGVWIVFIVFSDCIYYYITNSETNRFSQNIIRLRDQHVLASNAWTDQLINEIDKFIEN